MRRIVAATVLGLALASPTFAADADTTPATPLAASAVTAVSTLTAADEQSGTGSIHRFSYGRPGALPAMYAASVFLQGYDAFSTMKALGNGGREANPVMQSIVQHPAAFLAVKAGMTTASIMAAEQLWKNNHRLGAIGLMIASNAMMGYVAANNARVLSSLK